MSEQKFGVHFGAMADPIEQQLNKQGLTLGEHAERTRKMANGLVRCWMADVLSEAEYRAAQKRLMKRVSEWAHSIKEDP